MATHPGLRFAYPGLLDETPSGYRSDITGGQGEEPQTHRIQRDVNAVSTVSAAGTGIAFDEQVEVFEGALMHDR